MGKDTSFFPEPNLHSQSAQVDLICLSIVRAILGGWQFALNDMVRVCVECIFTGVSVCIIKAMDISSASEQRIDSELG